MEGNYFLNPAIKICLDAIEPGSLEKEVQTLWENMIWTAFPASDNWMNQTKHKQGATEPDNKIMKLVHFNAGWAPVDVLIVELKRVREDISLRSFARVACDLLDDHMAESTNSDSTVLFGAIGIGRHVQFYQRVLPRGKLQTFHSNPLHLEHDVVAVQQYFDHFKTNIPQMLSLPLVATPGLNSSTESPSQSGARSDYLASNVGITFETQGPSSWAGPSPDERPEEYFFVKDSQYFFCDHENHITSAQRPKNAWVWNENGWVETDGTRRWRYWDGKRSTYK